MNTGTCPMEWRSTPASNRLDVWLAERRRAWVGPLGLCEHSGGAPWDVVKTNDPWRWSPHKPMYARATDHHHALSESAINLHAN